MGLCNRVVCQGGDEGNLREFRCGCGCCCGVKALGAQEIAYVSHVLKKMRCTSKVDETLQNVPVLVPRALKGL